MISIITAVYNQLDMNRLYYESLCRTTDCPWELIVIDNGSTDGTLEYFRSLGDRVKVIANSGNYSYPHCQNQGIAAARYDILAFFNNDIITPPIGIPACLRYLARTVTRYSPWRATTAWATRRPRTGCRGGGRESNIR